MPWEDQVEKKKKLQAANNARLAFVFHVHRPDEQRLANLLESAKYRNLWYEHWGGVAFTVERPGFNTPAGVKDRYIEMVQSHGAMQLSMGAAGHCHRNKEIHSSPYPRREWPATRTN